jgi:hypothetical protein
MGNTWCCRCCKKKKISREAFKQVSAHEIRGLMKLVFTTPQWKDFLEYCERCGVDGQEVCNWTDAILDKEYQISDPRVREHILDIYRETMIQLWLHAASKRQ